MPQRPQPSLRLADGGNFVTRWAQNVMRPKNTERRLREIEAPPPAPVAQPAPPPPPPPPNATPDNPAGIRFQDGGHVPGKGRGDKIPAKYEPGEFVVSNDMIDDNPGLREQLSGLRAETLAARGKTVEEADAKALNGGRRPSLRADNGGTYDPSKGRDLIARPNFIRPDGPPAYQPPPQISGPAPGTSLQVPPQRPNFTMGGSEEVLGNSRPSSRINVGAEDVLPKSAPPPRAPTNALVRTADIGRNGYTPNFQMGGRDPGVPHPLSAADAAAYDASPEGRATKAQVLKETRGYFQGKPSAAAAPTVAAPAAPTPAANGSTTLRRVASGVGNTLMYGGAGVGGVLAAKGLRDVGAPKGTAAVPGERQSGDSASSMQIPTGGNRPAPAAQPYNFWTDNEIGRNLGNAASAIAPLGGVATAAGAPGAATKAFGLADAAVTSLAAGVRDERDLRNPYADANAAKIAASDAQDKAAAPTGSPGLPDGVFRHGRGQYSDDPNGMNMPKGFTGQPSAANNAILQRMSDQSQAESMARVGLGQYAAEVQRARAINADEAARNNSPAARMQRLADPFTAEGRAMRNLQMDIASSVDRKGRPTGKTQALLDQYKAATGAYLEEPGQQRVAETERYTADQGLRGTVYSADATRAGQMATARSKQQRDALKDAMDLERHDQTTKHNATNNARERLKGMAVRDDGKGGTVVDEGRLARLESTLTKMSPGWALADETTQAKLLRKAEASVNILEGLNNQRNNGWLQALGIDGESAQLDNLPHKEMKGAKLGEVGFVDGATTPGTSRKDYVIETPGGHKLYLPRSSVNQGELELLKSLGVDITGITGSKK